MGYNCSSTWHTDRSFLSSQRWRDWFWAVLVRILFSWGELFLRDLSSSGNLCFLTHFRCYQPWLYFSFLSSSSTMKEFISYFDCKTVKRNWLEHILSVGASFVFIPVVREHLTWTLFLYRTHQSLWLSLEHTYVAGVVTPTFTKTWVESNLLAHIADSLHF